MPLRSGILFSTLCRLAAAALLGGALVGCESEETPSSYVARVGDHYLTQSELNERLQGMGPVPDSSEARQQIIEQWVDRALLLREAKRLNLEEVPGVKEKLQEQRRSTLVTAMTNRIYENTDRSPTDEEVRTYFERHRKQLALREPYVRVRHLSTTNIDSARTVRRTLLGTREATADSIWNRLIRTYADAPSRAKSVSNRFLPEGRLFAQLPYVQDELAALQEGEVAPVIEDDSLFHVLQLVRRIPEGTQPKLRWIEPEIRRRLQIRIRKQMYAREVERLRNKAKAENLVETP
jgi:hypothetical protein